MSSNSNISNQIQSLISSSKNQNNNNNTRSLSESNFRSGTGITNSAIATGIINSEAILNEKKKLIVKLEHKNREILREIKRLRIQQESNRSLDDTFLNLNASTSRESTPLTINSSKSILAHQFQQQNYPQQQPNLLAELKSLKLRKGELDTRINTLEHNRGELLTQLSQLDNVMNNMKVSKKTKKLKHKGGPF
jgi:hypothetical protein